MEFAEKLDFLMSMTKMTNSTLAHYLVLDTSYISRLRTGKRLMPKSDELIRRMAGYIAGKLTDNTMRQLNYRVEVLEESTRDVAESFLRENGLIR